MDANRPRSWLFLALLFVLAIPWAHGEVIPLTCVDGRCEWIQPADAPPCFLILGSLSAPTKSYRVNLQTEPTQAGPYLPREKTLPDVPASALVDEKWRRLRQTPESYVPRSDPPRRKTFYIFTADHSLDNAGNYAQVSAELCGLGKQVQVYLDSRDPLTADMDRAVADVIRTFDREVYPWGRQKLGQVVDVDRDGRFTVLFSSLLSRLQAGKATVDGFVRGSDFLLNVPPPYGNRCDMLYLNSRLQAGPHLRTVLAHEYTHAVNFCEHVINNPPDCRQDEESWLSEGLSHLVEELHQHGWSNLDYRVRSYLAQPERYPLLVPDYYGSGLWRTPGTRGCTFLFLRWCQTRTGAELPHLLIQSPFTGVRNLENATRQPFARLYRDWAVSLVLDESWKKEQLLPDRFTRLQEKPANATPMYFGPSFDILAENAYRCSLVGTGLKFVLLPGGQAVNRHYRIQADQDSRLQVTLVELDRKRGLLDLRCQPLADRNSLLLEARAQGSPIRLEGVFWEKVPPLGIGREGTDYRDLANGKAGPLIGVGEKWVGTLTDFLPVNRDQDLVIRIVGKDAQGRMAVGCGYVKR
jgi:hypothetical protein